MHEMAVCQQMLDQVGRIARAHGARRVELIRVAAGPLSGVEAPLLRRAFEVARAGTVADAARLEIQTGPVVVHCRACDADSTVAPNRLLCGTCGTWRVRVVQGEDLMLLSVELAGLANHREPAQERERECHV